MDCKDLMVGDWVICNHYQDKPFTKQFGVADFAKGEYEFCEPIPLTEEILVKNGFEKNHNDEAPAEECYFYRLFAKPCGWLDIDAFGLEEELGAEFVYNDIALNYVHQLQRLLNLCNIDKEIIL